MGPCTCPRLLDPRRLPGYLGPGPLAWVLWPWPGPTWSESLGLSAWPGSLAQGLQRPRWARGQGPLGQALDGPRMHTGANRHTQDRCVTSILSSPVCLDHASSMSLFNFNPCHHCTPNQCTIHQTKSQRSYKWSRIERVHSQVPTMTYAFLAFIAFIAFLGAAAAAFAAFLAMLSTGKD